jgi:hypothetical protein
MICTLMSASRRPADVRACTTTEKVPGTSPRGISPTMRWRPLVTFVQLLVDMKNAQIPGAYRRYGHDYRPDLARFIREVFDLPCSDEQLARVEEALEAREALRQRLFSKGPDREVVAETVERPHVGGRVRAP